MGTPTPLARTAFVQADGRRIHVYGEIRGASRLDAPRSAPADLHLRRDELSDSWVAIAPARNVRPHRSRPSEREALPGSPAERYGCPLCPGGPEFGFGYDAAVFDNRFPSFVLDPAPVSDPADPRLAQSVGTCEVVMYTDRHEASFASLTSAETARVIAVWRDRTSTLWADERLAYVLAFENRGAEIGSTLSHPHGQIYGFGHLPPWIERRAAALEAGRARTGECVTCAVVAEQQRSHRVVQADPYWAIGVPFAARWPYEIHVRAIRHEVRRLDDLTAEESRALAEALHGVVGRYDALFGFELPYMMVVHEAPRGAPDWHLAVEFYPPHRTESLTKIRASVETATLLFINDTLPEASASRLASLRIAQRDAHPGFVVVPVDEDVE